MSLPGSTAVTRSKPSFVVVRYLGAESTACSLCIKIGRSGEVRGKEGMGGRACMLQLHRQVSASISDFETIALSFSPVIGLLDAWVVEEGCVKLAYI